MSGLLHSETRVKYAPPRKAALAIACKCYKSLSIIIIILDEGVYCVAASSDVDLDIEEALIR